MKKSQKRMKLTELSPETLNAFDQETLIAVVMRLYEQNKQLSEQLQSLVQEKYGRKTERFEDPDQLRILPTGSAPSEQQSVEESQTESMKPAQRSKRPGHTRNPMPSHLNRKRLERQPRQEELTCQCGEHRTKVNDVVRNSRYEYVPATLYIEDIVDAVWECPRCHDAVVVSAEICEPIPNGTAGPRLLSRIVVNKLLDHLPLHRQEQMFAREGIDISRSTMCGWMAAIASIVLPVYDCMKTELLKSKIICTDDTPVKVQDRKKEKNIKRGHEWIFTGDKNHPVNMFHYTEGRGRDGPKKFLPGFKGFLQGDCFSGNQALCAETGATMVACRAHERRYFKKARPNNKSLCDQALKMFQDLFEIEETARELKLASDEIVLMRQQESAPLLEKLKAWLDQQAITALPRSSFGKAIFYSLNNWEVLNNYLLDGDLRIDNNLAEQQMKMVAIGRKNWNFFGSDDAGKNASVLLSLLATCKRHNVEPIAYLQDVLEKLTNNPHCNAEMLIPYNWKPEMVQAEIKGPQPTPKAVIA